MRKLTSGQSRAMLSRVGDVPFAQAVAAVFEDGVDLPGDADHHCRGIWSSRAVGYTTLPIIWEMLSSEG